MNTIPKKLQSHCVPVGDGTETEDEWLEIRKQGIGASDAPKILGLSDHADAVVVWKSKTEREVEDKPWLEPYAWAGHYIEKPVLDYVFEDVPDVDPVHGDDMPVLKSIKNPHLRCSLDGYDPLAGAVHEIKSDSWGDNKRVPDCHWAQVQHQLAVTGAPKGYVHHVTLPVERDKLRDLVQNWIDQGAGDFARGFLIEHGEVNTYPIERDDEWIDRWIDRSRQWWERYVENDVRPPSSEEREGTVDLSHVDELKEKLDEKSHLDARWNNIAKPIKEERDEIKDACRSIAERYAPLEADGPKRWNCGPHKGTACKSYGNYYYRLYAADVEDITDDSEDDDLPTEELTL